MELYRDDCLSKLKDFADKSIDITFTSPPYNRKRNDKYTNYDDTIKDYYLFLVEVTNLLLAKTKRHVIINLQTNYYNRQDIYKFIGHYYNKIQNVIVWEKSNPLPANGHNITNAFEYFFILGDTAIKSNTTYTKNHITTSINNSITKIHKAVMKQEVADWFIEKFTKENDVVLDCFMGLGTTGLSCIKYNRDFIGIELDEEYFNIAKERIEEANGIRGRI
jgi:DNA modification methylase